MNEHGLLVLYVIRWRRNQKGETERKGGEAMQKKTIMGIRATRNWVRRLLDVRLPLVAANGLRDR